jgi:hypothetical protein
MSDRCLEVQSTHGILVGGETRRFIPDSWRICCVEGGRIRRNRLTMWHRVAVTQLQSPVPVLCLCGTSTPDNHFVTLPPFRLLHHTSVPDASIGRTWVKRDQLSVASSK